MSELKGKATENMHRAGDAAKKAADAILDSGRNIADEASAAIAGKSKDLAHKAGKKLTGVGKRLQGA